MKTLSIVGIIISVLGLFLTFFINSKISGFIDEILDYSYVLTKYKKQLDIFDIIVDHFDFIQPNSYFLLYGFFIYFLMFSIIVYRKS